MHLPRTRFVHRFCFACRLISTVLIPSESDIRLGFTHARVSSKSSFDHAFQYKIMTQILPTNQYLARYRIRDSNICEKCYLSVDTIFHCLWQCQLVVPFVDRISDFLRIQCNFQENIDSLQYFFGFKNFRKKNLPQILFSQKKNTPKTTNSPNHAYYPHTISK